MSTTMTIMERLKSSTKPLHEAAEGHPFQHALGSASLPLTDYAAYLGQLYLIHQSLENGLREAARSHQAVAAAIAPEQFTEPFLVRDLARLGVDLGTVRPNAATEELLAEISEAAANAPARLLGYHYVLLGSKHGGKLIARNLQSRLQLDADGGCAYFDPYGGTFMELWLKFKAGMNGSGLTESEIESVVDAAKVMFVAVGKIGSVLMEQEPMS